MKVSTVPFHTNGVQPVASVRMIGEKSCYLGIGPETEIFDLVIHFKDIESVIALGKDIVAAAIAVQSAAFWTNVEAADSLLEKLSR